MFYKEVNRLWKLMADYCRDQKEMVSLILSQLLFNKSKDSKREANGPMKFVELMKDANK